MNPFLHAEICPDIRKLYIERNKPLLINCIHIVLHKHRGIVNQAAVRLIMCLQICNRSI